MEQHHCGNPEPHGLFSFRLSLPFPLSTLSLSLRLIYFPLPSTFFFSTFPSYHSHILSLSVSSFLSLFSQNSLLACILISHCFRLHTKTLFKLSLHALALLRIHLTTRGSITIVLPLTRVPKLFSPIGKKKPYSQNTIFFKASVF